VWEALHLTLNYRVLCGKSLAGDSDVIRFHHQKEVPVTGKQTNRFLALWDKLELARGAVEYQQAALLHDIRDVFPKGKHGDNNFRVWLTLNLHIHGLVISKFLRAIKAYINYDEGEWRAYGWVGMTYIAALPIRSGKRLVARLKSLSLTSYQAIRDTADELGYKAVNTGRPGRLDVERDLIILTNWIKLVHSQYEIPHVPARVKKAMSSGLLEKTKRLAKDTG